MLQAKMIYSKYRVAGMSIFTSIMLLVGMTAQVAIAAAAEVNMAILNVFDLFFISIAAYEVEVGILILSLLMIIVAIMGVVTLFISLSMILKGVDKNIDTFKIIKKFNMICLSIFTLLGLILYFYMRIGAIAELIEFEQGAASLAVQNISTTIYVPLLVTMIVMFCDTLVNTVINRPTSDTEVEKR